MLAELERVVNCISSLEIWLAAVHAHSNTEIVAGEEAPNGEDEVKDPHHASGLMERIESIARPEIM